MKKRRRRKKEEKEKKETESFEIGRFRNDHPAVSTFFPARFWTKLKMFRFFTRREDFLSEAWLRRGVRNQLDLES